jgi:hypothetical protein
MSIPSKDRDHLYLRDVPACGKLPRKWMDYFANQTGFCRAAKPAGVILISERGPIPCRSIQPF